MPSYAPTAARGLAEERLATAIRDQMVVGCRSNAVGQYNPTDLQRRAEVVAESVAAFFPDEKAGTLRPYIRGVQEALAFSNIQRIEEYAVPLSDPWAKASINYQASLIAEPQIADDPEANTPQSQFDNLFHFADAAFMGQVDGMIIAAVVKACKLNVVVTYDKSTGETRPSKVRIDMLMATVESTGDVDATAKIAQYEQAAQEAIDNATRESDRRH